MPYRTVSVSDIKDLGPAMNKSEAAGWETFDVVSSDSHWLLIQRRFRWFRRASDASAKDQVLPR
jgi:hypothetical protein